MNKVLYQTRSLCPECFSVIDADYFERNSMIYMGKTCPVHGYSEVLVWEDTADNFLQWIQYGGGVEKDEAESGCPVNCGICGSHKRKSVSAALMVTSRCDVNCPVCFTSARGDDCYEPDLEELLGQVDYYRKASGDGSLIEFCGGEPTTRKDLEKLAQEVRNRGFSYIQLNTNGIRLAHEPDLAYRLKESGVTTVYLGFDGITEEPYIYKYGKNLLDIKKKAVANCAAAELAVVLVPCIVPGKNDEELGGIISFAKENIPAVKAVYFQPISYFGVYPREKRIRITIPEILRKIEQQTDGEICTTDFMPGGCEHPQCSFGGYFIPDKSGKLRAVTKYGPKSQRENPEKTVRQITAANWTYNKRKYLTIGGMAFQDVWNIDLERLKYCTIHIIGREQSLVPLCAKYLTTAGGKRLYKNIN